MLRILSNLRPFGYARRRAAGKRRSRVQQPCVKRLEVRALMASFQPLGAYTSAAAVSADGSTVVGNSLLGAGGPIYWTQRTGVVFLRDSSGNIYPGVATGVSGNGSVIVGDGSLGGGAFRWANGIAAPISQLAAANANSVSTDGTIIAGDVDTGGGWSPYMLTGATLEVNFLPPGDYSNPFLGTTMSANGDVLAGNPTGGLTEGPPLGTWQWNDGTLIQFPDSTTGSDATAVSPDGSVVVGSIGGNGAGGLTQAFEWTNGGTNGVVTPLTWPAGYNTGSATAVSTDGSTIVGVMSPPGNGGGGGGGGQPSAAFIWNQASGVQDLQQVLTTDDGLGSYLTGWTLTEATAITPDGNRIVGNGIDPQGRQEGWIVNLNGQKLSGTTTSLQASPPSSVYGQRVTLTATVSPDPGMSGTPTGSVAFYDGATDLGTASLIGDTATLPVTSLPVGTDGIAASYGGDSQFGTSMSSTSDVAVQQDKTSVILTPSANPGGFGQQITFTAVVSPFPPGVGTPKGSVTFYYGATDLGAAPLIGATAALPVSTLPLGTDAITASYGGDPDFVGKTSATLNEVITTVIVKFGTRTTLAASPKSAIVGRSVTLTATVKPTGPVSGSPTGTVTFTDDGITLRTMSLSRGKATLRTSSLHLGKNDIEVIYIGDKHFKGSMSLPFVETITKPAKKAK
ncbi:MAG: Ig-like domain repeat protein [Isosphaeraceae bacterium]